MLSEKKLLLYNDEAFSHRAWKRLAKISYSLCAFVRKYVVDDNNKIVEAWCFLQKKPAPIRPNEISKVTFLHDILQFPHTNSVP